MRANRLTILATSLLLALGATPGWTQVDEGIKVHGHWTIDVRNPDGSLVTHREFENALQPLGRDLFARLLSRNATVGTWGVLLQGSTQTPGICGSQPMCGLFETTPPSDPSFSVSAAALTVSIPPGGNTIMLEGAATAAAHESIQKVHTLLGACPASVAPASAACALVLRDTSGALIMFTSKDISPLPIEAGQIIVVRVVISFS